MIYGKTRAGSVCDVFTAPIIVNEQCGDHPCPKPVAWGEGVVTRVSKERDSVLDPFMGSGTTGVACIRTGRKFVGCEIEQRYFDIAVKRIQRAWDDKCSELPFEPPPTYTQRTLIEESDATL